VTRIDVAGGITFSREEIESASTACTNSVPWPPIDINGIKRCAGEIAALGDVEPDLGAAFVELPGMPPPTFVAREPDKPATDALVDAAEALVESAGHGDGMPADGRYVGVRLVELNAFAGALARVRRERGEDAAVEFAIVGRDSLRDEDGEEDREP